MYLKYPMSLMSLKYLMYLLLKCLNYLKNLKFLMNLKYLMSLNLHHHLHKSL